MRLSIDLPVVSKMEQAADLLLAGFLWLLFSVPIITIGAATSALYYTTVKVVRKKHDTVCKAFLHSFRENIRQGSAMTLVYLLYVVFIASYFMFCRQGLFAMNRYAVVITGGLLIAPFILSILYIFPVISRLGFGMAGQFSFALYLSMRHLPTTVFLLTLLVSMCYGVCRLPLLLMFLPGGYAYISSFPIERAMKKHMKKEREKYERSDELQWYFE